VLANCIKTGTRIRSIRSKEDWAVTYVLDSGFVNFVKKNRKVLPEWFIEAIHSEHAPFRSDSKVLITPIGLIE
jgi:Rad3-related DNA helicase